MENFEEFNQLWESQPILTQTANPEKTLEKAENYLRYIKRGKIWTILILGSLMVGLFLYLGWAISHDFTGMISGLGLMVSAISIRLVLEFISTYRFNSINLESSLTTFHDSVVSFYIWQNMVNKIFIPILYLLYLVGFTMLLPYFKQSLSSGMYWYVLFSGYGFLLGFAFVIWRKIKMENRILETLKKISSEEGNG